jgi:hypothetical protein
VQFSKLEDDVREGLKFLRNEGVSRIQGSNPVIIIVLIRIGTVLISYSSARLSTYFKRVMGPRSNAQFRLRRSSSGSGRG